MTLQHFYQDADATETQEWLEAFAAIVERASNIKTWLRMASGLPLSKNHKVQGKLRV